jgi:hypothetical protein
MFLDPLVLQMQYRLDVSIAEASPSWIWTYDFVLIQPPPLLCLPLIRLCWRIPNVPVDQIKSGRLAKRGEFLLGDLISVIVSFPFNFRTYFAERALFSACKKREPRKGYPGWHVRC